jgi:hypothetical protein
VTEMNIPETVLAVGKNGKGRFELLKHVDEEI